MFLTLTIITITFATITPLYIHYLITCARVSDKYLAFDHECMVDMLKYPSGKLGLYHMPVEWQRLWGNRYINIISQMYNSKAYSKKEIEHHENQCTQMFPILQ